MDAELKLVGEYGLRCSSEIWRVQYALAKLRKAARTLLTLEPDDPKRIFEGAALLRRMNRYGLLADDELELDKVLQLTTQKTAGPTSPDHGLQARPGQVDPPRPCLDPPPRPRGFPIGELALLATCYFFGEAH